MNNEHTVLLAHGGGGRASRDLVAHEILSRFGSDVLNALPDAATLPSLNGPLIFSTDSFVVQPLCFPGGNIGHLAVHGTVNDIAVAGGVPRWISLALILEEGLPMETLRTVLDSIRDAAADCEITVATGDTKVVARGQCDGMYINTAGIGARVDGFLLDASSIIPGDTVLVSGPVGDHGAAVMACRQNIEIGGAPQSDTGPVHRLTLAVGDLASEIRFMRDPTRGGLAAVLNEAVDKLTVDVVLEESHIPLCAGTRSVCELLGLDPLHMASEGRLVAFCSRGAADAVLDCWKRFPEGQGATTIGCVREGKGRVIMQTVAGGQRLVHLPHGELLPRIC